MPPKISGYETAFNSSLEFLAAVWENGDTAEKLRSVCGAEPTAKGFALSFFNTSVDIDLREKTVGGDSVKLAEKILILHYLAGPLENESGTGAALNSENWATFKQLPGASFYNSAYRKQGPEFVLHKFLSRPDSLVKAGIKLGGRKGDFGDYSAVLRPFPSIQVMPLLYLGDEELPPEAEILFSGNITSFFTLEDVAVLARVIVSRLSKAAE